MSRLQHRLAKFEKLDQQIRSEHDMPMLEHWAAGLIRRYNDLIDRPKFYEAFHQKRAEYYKTTGYRPPPVPDYTKAEKEFLAQCEAGDLERAHEIISRFERLRDGV